jgi:hypothetical protein
MLRHARNYSTLVVIIKVDIKNNPAHSWLEVFMMIAKMAGKVVPAKA